MNRQIFKHIQDKLWGYSLIPHELLHVLACRIINKPCEYEWGRDYVRPLAAVSRRERLFVLLFPFIFCWTLGFLFHMLWGLSLIFVIRTPLETYFFVSGPTWHFALPVIATFLIIYSGCGYGDIIKAYRLLTGKDQSNYNRPEPHQQAEDQKPHRDQP